MEMQVGRPGDVDLGFKGSGAVKDDTKALTML